MAHEQGGAAAGAADGALSRSGVAIVAAVLLGYAVLSYYSDSRPSAVNLAAALSVMPVFVIGLVLAWRWLHPLPAALMAVVAAVLLYRFWDVIRSNYAWSNLVQQAGTYGLVTLSFARSLSAGAVPLCTQLADRLHGPLTGEEADYTNRATAAWAVFYGLLTVAIIVLFFTTTSRVWSFFVNFATFGLIGLMFALERVVRRRCIPHQRSGSALAALRQFVIG